MDAEANGHFVWRAVMAADADSTMNFYRDIFGWTSDNLLVGGERYSVLSNQGVEFGGLSSLPPNGETSYWISYIQVDDVDACCTQAVELGGSIDQLPTDIEGIGRFAALRDPRGAAFSVLTSPGTPIVSVAVPIGGVVWNELVTDDIGASVAFYRTLFGYEASEVPGSEGGYVLFSRPGDMPPSIRAGCFHAPGALPSPAWLIYFEVEQLEETRARIEAAGGRNFGGITEVPNFGRTGWSADPSGARFGVRQSAG